MNEDKEMDKDRQLDVDRQMDEDRQTDKDRQRARRGFYPAHIRLRSEISRLSDVGSPCRMRSSESERDH